MRDNFDESAEKIERIIGYRFRDRSLLMQAFTRTSFCNERNRSEKIKYQSNEVLEFFGDTVLSAAVITYFIKEHTERYARGVRTGLGEGDFSNIKSKLCDKTNLSRAVRQLGLEKHLRMGEGDKKLGVASEPSVMEDLFESIVGAVFIDSDRSMDAAAGVVSNMLNLAEYASSRPPLQSAKNALQEFCDSKERRLPHPVYKTVSEGGPDHKKEYERGVYIGERLVASARGKNLKLADAAAAERALAILRGEAEKPKNDNKGLQKQAEVPQKTQHGAAMKPQEPKKRTGRKVSAEEAYAALRTYAEREKIASAQYRDMGLLRTEAGQVHKIVCAFMGESAEGVGPDRHTARDAAAVLMYERVKAKSSTPSRTKKQK
ncbi:MAG: ribonuclease III family protein [Clostridia bacterium]|nr:ribonuclease III family protein [Clostridia bacterium]